MSNKILQLKGSFKTDGNHTKPAAPNIPEKGLPVDVDHLRDLKQQLEEIPTQIKMNQLAFVVFPSCVNRRRACKCLL